MQEEIQASAGQEAFEENSYQPKWWQTLLGRWLSVAGFNPLLSAVMTALVIVSIALAAWVLALSSENRYLRTQLPQPVPLQTAENGEPSSVIQDRLQEVQRQISAVKGQVTQQQTDQELLQKNSLADENARLIQELSDLSKPQLDHPIIDATSVSQMPPPPDKTKEAINVVNVPATAASFTVLLRSVSELRHQQYLVELLDRRSGKAVWSGQQKKTESPAFSLTLAKRNYPAGKYRVRISGLNGKKKEEIDTWDLQFNYLSAPTAKPARKK